MYKVMIVDDEILVRVGLKSTIDWESIGFTIVAEASNGEQAIEMFERHRPDVILTDIRMPKMDGLQLTEAVKKRDPKVKVAILTCYDEFSYAREALKLGASSYILKSEVEDDELINLMTNIRRELDLEMGKMERYCILQHQINSNINDLKEKLLSDLIDSKLVENKEFYSRCRNLNFDVERTAFMLIVLYKDNIDELTDCSDKDWKLLDYGVINIISEILNEQGLKFLINTREDGFVILLNRDCIDLKEIELAVGRIRDSVEQYLNISLSAVLSRKFENIFSSSEAFKECTGKSDMMFYFNRGSIILSHTPELQKANIIELKEKYTRKILNQMDEENLDKAYEILGELESMFKEKVVYPINVKLYFISLINDILEHYYGCILNKDELNDYSNYNSIILNASKMTDAARMIKVFMTEVVNSVKQNLVDNSKNIIIKIINFIEKNYCEKISLESLAAHVNLSKQYLCYLFKRETGQNISVYINNVRIDRAKELIRRHDYKVKEIYDMVGFSDQQYFCKIFKKVSGMTVAQYKDKIMKNSSQQV